MSRRLVGVDAARGLALIGVMVVHVLPGGARGGGVSLSHQIASGRAAALFAVLAGVGLALFTGGTQPPAPRRRNVLAVQIAVRGLLIGAIGLGLGGVDSGVAVILAYYGALFLLAIPLLRLRAGQLAVLAVVVAVVVPLVSHATRNGNALPFGGAGLTFERLVDSPGLSLRTLTLLGYYPALPWLSYLCAGLAVGRLNLRDRRTAVAVLVSGAAVALAASAASWLLLGPMGGRGEIKAVALAEHYQLLLRRQGLFGNAPTDTWWWQAIDSPHSSTPLDLLHTGGVAIAILGAMLLLERFAGRLLTPLAAAGSMTLSLYVVHVLLLASGWLPNDPEVSLVLQVCAALLVATLWRRRIGRGPLEAAIASISSAVSPAARRR